MILVFAICFCLNCVGGNSGNRFVLLVLASCWLMWALV